MKLLTELKRDYERHGSSPRNMAFWAVATYRIGRWAYEQPTPVKQVGGKVYGALSLIVEATSGILFNREATVGEDFHLVHSGNIKISPRAVIGDRVGIMQDVTIGESPDRVGAPVIGNDVFIGAGAKVLGPVKIGDRARVAANSLVVTDVPPDTTAIGVPAKIMRFPSKPPTLHANGGAHGGTNGTAFAAKEPASAEASERDLTKPSA